MVDTCDNVIKNWAKNVEVMFQKQVFYLTFTCDLEDGYANLGLILFATHCLDMVICLFVALRPKSTAMVIAGWSVHLTTLFPGQA